MKIILKKIAGIGDLLNQVPLRYFLVFIGIIYFLLCLNFSFERSFNTDCSYQLFNIINKKSFFFQEYRYGVFLTQIPLIIAVFFKLPIILLILSYNNR